MSDGLQIPLNQGLPTHYLPAEELSLVLSSQPHSADWQIAFEFFGNPEVIIFRVENALFRVNREQILTLVEGLAEPLENYFNTQKNPALGTEKEPYHLAGVTATTFRIFLKWLNHKHWEKLIMPQDDLLQLYRFATMYICSTAARWSVDQFELLDITASHKLALGMALGIRTWIEPAAKALLRQPIYQLSMAEREEIGFDVALTLSNAQQLLAEHRLQIAVTPPHVHYGYGAVQCAHYGSEHKRSPCAEAWDRIWWTRVGRELLHPTNPITFDKAETFIRSIEFTGVSTQCVTAGLDVIAAKFDLHEQVMNRVLQKLYEGTSMSPFNQVSD
ncbi:hypothetical protein C8J55DRAFT_566349 [Lentinula edodes]|uniref:BTB domain-containing protein n=1 Tax=Lentinula lateritia TaxID=40482 RepID=A0A9W8ZS12_9AGAR|nr:hypothetical protein C8J55DRAFT_566349 [Lentinula edodes]